MSREELATRVPLPEVPHHTEDIIFGALDLPLGFDQSRLLVNVRGFEHIRQAAGLGVISVVADSNETVPFDPGIDGVNAHGTATMSVIGKRKQQPLAFGSLRYNSAIGTDGAPDVVIEIDNVELEARIEERGKYKRGAFDPQARAGFLNKAIKGGLSEASFSASFGLARVPVSVFAYSVWSVITPLSMHPFASPEAVLSTGLLANIAVATHNAINHSNSTELRERVRLIKQFRHSLMYGCTPDRYLAGSALIPTTKLIRARA